MTEKKQHIDPEILAQLRDEILKELEDKEAREKEKDRIRKEEAKKSYKEYSMKMKSSSEPWVDIVGIAEDPEKGIRIELDWNNAFVKHLRENGYKGADDETVVQRYVAVLARSVAEDMEDGDQNEYE
jgi:hypothetical protein